MSLDAYNRALATAAENLTLRQELDKLRRYFMQTMLAIATAMPEEEFRVSKLDYERTKRRALATFTDPETGDRVFVSKPIGRESALEE